MFALYTTTKLHFCRSRKQWTLWTIFYLLYAENVQSCLSSNRCLYLIYRHLGRLRTLLGIFLHVAFEPFHYDNWYLYQIPMGTGEIVWYILFSWKNIIFRAISCQTCPKSPHGDGATSDNLLLLKNKDIDKCKHKNYNFTGENSLCLIGGEYFYISYVRYTEDKWM